MEHLLEQNREGILVVKLASGKANALNPPMLEELITVVERASTDSDVLGLVLASDRPRFFSSGFDIHQVFQFDRPTMSQFFGRFIDLYEALLAMPKPVVAAITGHAVAGGAVLALTADFRILAEGDYRFALTEVDLGVELPAKVRRMMIATGGAQAAKEILLGGAFIAPARALAVGLADEIVPLSDVDNRAIARCRTLAAKPPAAFAAIKRTLQDQARIWETASDRDALGRFLDFWFSQESVNARQALAASMRR